MSATAKLNLQPYWMPFTGNRAFKEEPRLFRSAEGMYYTTLDGRRVLDGIAGLWCCNAGHCHPSIVAAIQSQAAELDYSTAFQMGHPKIFALAERLVDIAPTQFRYAFFTNSGSEAVDTALKIALGYHRMRGEGQRTRIIGRERGYHGVGFGGISVGGISANRKMFSGNLMPGVDHLAHTHHPEKNAFSKGQPSYGGHLADELEHLLALHDPSTVAAVIVEPIAGSTGVLIPPQGYLGRLREICSQNGVLLIFDEVITGFGRTGAAFAADTFGVEPDILTVAKGLTSGSVPMGGVLVGEEIYQAFMTGPKHAIEFFHGYTYSGHPLAAAAGLAALQVYQEEDLFARARALAPLFERLLHGLADRPNVIDVRNLGLVGAVELAPLEGQPTARALEVFSRCFEAGVLVRTTGDTVALAPPLIVEESQLKEIAQVLGEAIESAP